MRVADIMTRAVVTVAMDDSLRVAREKLRRGGFHHLLVMRHDRLIGVVSDRDILRELSPFLDQLAERAQDARTLERPVHQLMTRALVVVGPDCSVREATERLLATKVSCLPVVSPSGVVEGIVTWRDLIRALL